MYILLCVRYISIICICMCMYALAYAHTTRTHTHTHTTMYINVIVYSYCANRRRTVCTLHYPQTLQSDCWVNTISESIQKHTAATYLYFTYLGFPNKMTNLASHLPQTHHSYSPIPLLQWRQAPMQPMDRQEPPHLVECRWLTAPSS